MVDTCANYITEMPALSSKCVLREALGYAEGEVVETGGIEPPSNDEADEPSTGVV